MGTEENLSREDRIAHLLASSMTPEQWAKLAYQISRNEEDKGGWIDHERWRERAIAARYLADLVVEVANEDQEEGSTLEKLVKQRNEELKANRGQ